TTLFRSIENRHLRRARRRSGLGQVLPQDRSGLCQLQSVPGADRPAGVGSGGADEIIEAPLTVLLPPYEGGQGVGWDFSRVFSGAPPTPPSQGGEIGCL